MQSHLHSVQIRPTIDFQDALAAASGTFTPPYVGTAVNNIPGLPPWGSRRFLIRVISFVCPQNVGLEFDFFGSAAGLTNAVGSDTFIARYQFASANGQKFNNGALFRYYVDGLSIPYYDLDGDLSVTPPLVHVAIENIDTIAKSIGAAGAIAGTIWFEPVIAIQG